ncbi:unnamed protein product [Sphagnum balticum]
MLKMGTYGFLRFAIPLFPEAASHYAWLFIALAVFGIVYGALVAMVQPDIKKLVAYSSVSHLGYVILGLFTFNIQGVSGGLYQMLNHGVSTGGLFLLVGMIYERTHSREISRYGGLAKVLPVFAIMFFLITISSIAVPGTNGFIGEFLILLGTFEMNKGAAIIAVTGVIWGAVYMLWLYKRVFFGKAGELVAESDHGHPLKDLSLREIACCGMLTLTSSNDLIVSFIGLEIMSIALYVLIGLGHEQQFSKEAAFKYFILGSFASAIFLYGIALVFGATGSTTISHLGLHGMILEAKNGLLLTGMILLLVGIGFKVSLFPFHAWTPDVYQGAPTSVSGFMATGVKVVMFTLFLRLAMTHIFMAEPKMIAALQIIAVLTMTVGNITAIVQENIKRMIAYSSIAHAGYILIGVIAACTSKTPEAGSATLFYLVGYSVMNLGAFAVVNILKRRTWQPQHYGLLRARL